MNTKIPFWRTIQFSYTAILLTGVVLFIGLLLLTQIDRQHQSQLIYEDRKTEQRANFDTVTRLDGKSLSDIAYENTYWDDLVNFIASPTQEFSDEVLRPQLDTYQAEAIWNYNADYQLVSNINSFTESNKDTDLQLSAENLKAIFANSPSVHFYRATDAGLLEVFGSTVHPTSDKAHKTTPLGYFFIARLLDADYQKTLSENTTSMIEVLPRDKMNTKQTEYGISSGKIAFLKDLNDFDGSAVGQMYVEYNSSAIKRVSTSFDQLMLVIISGYIILTTLVYLISGRLIIRPLRRIYRALLTGKTKHLENLPNKESEFGEIANLIITSLKQRDELGQAINQKSAAQIALEKRSNELELTNRLMINRELRMIELKKQIAELKTSKDKVKK